MDLKNRNQMDVVDYDEETGKYFIVTDKFSDHAAVYLYDARTDKFDAEPCSRTRTSTRRASCLVATRTDYGKIAGLQLLTARCAPSTGRTRSSFLSRRRSMAAFKGQTATITSYTEDRSKLLFSVEGARNPPAYYLLLEQGEARRRSARASVDQT